MRIGTEIDSASLDEMGDVATGGSRGQATKDFGVIQGRVRGLAEDYPRHDSKEQNGQSEFVLHWLTFLDTVGAHRVPSTGNRSIARE